MTPVLLVDDNLAHSNARELIQRRRAMAAGDEGMTLIELLVAVAILGLSGTAIIGMFIVMTSTTFLHKEQANVGNVLRSAAEAVNAAPYDCATASATYGAALSSVTVPPVVKAPTIASITTMNGNGSPDCSGGNTPLELVTVQVKSAENRVSQQLTVVKGPTL